MNTKRLTDEDLNIIEACADIDSLTHDQVVSLIDEIRRQRARLAEIDAATRSVEAGIDRVSEQNAELLTALQYLDAIIVAYQQPGIASLVVSCRLAKEWRGVKTSQDAPGATQ